MGLAGMISQSMFSPRSHAILEVLLASPVMARAVSALT